MKIMLAAALAAALTAAGGAGLAPAPPAHAAPAAAQTCPLPRFGPGSAYRPVIRPDRFGPDVTNAWFPLPVGRTLVYTGTKDGRTALDVVTVTTRTRVVDRVRTRVLEDRLLENGRVSETTADYYAQDRCGDVWYFGEDTAELDAAGRVVSRAGSFHAGVHGAQPGVFMQARPQIGRTFRQEWAPGRAEDRFRALSTAATASVPYRRSAHALRTREETALEPGVVDGKLYVRGIGEVAEFAVHGPVERLSLVALLG